MKRLWLISAIVIPMVLLGFFVSCDNAGGLSGYYIYTEFTGSAYELKLEWKLGPTNVDADACGWVRTGDPDETTIIATPDVITGESEPYNYILIVFEGTTTGTYSISDVHFPYFIGDLGAWVFTDITLEVTVYEDVGGVIAGTFSGTVEHALNNSTMTVENGQFNVIRAPDDSSTSGD